MRYKTLPNCQLCGRFVGLKKTYIYWYIGDLDREYAHTECWNNPGNRTITKLIKDTFYIKRGT